MAKLLIPRIIQLLIYTPFLNSGEKDEGIVRSGRKFTRSRIPGALTLFPRIKVYVTTQLRPGAII
jgi:hypothetical protein